MPVKWKKPYLAATGGVYPELVTVGWIRECFATQQFEKIPFPPLDIAKLVSGFVQNEQLHWIQSNEDDDAISHFVIDMKRVVYNNDNCLIGDEDNFDWSTIH